MLKISIQEIQSILSSYHIFSDVLSVEELLRYDCDVTEQDRKEIKLILKIKSSSHLPVVIKFRGGNTDRNRQFVIEAQTKFAEILRANGIATPKYYKNGDSFSTAYKKDGYLTVVTVEDFCDAVMQGWFIAHCMDYEQPITEEYSDMLAKSFFEGYCKYRPFSDNEKNLARDLYSVISAFGIPYENDLRKGVEKGDTKLVSDILQRIYHLISR